MLAQRQRDQQRLGDTTTSKSRKPASARTWPAAAEQVDPQYRLAAAELERDWDDKLRALRQAEEAAARFAQAPTESTLSPSARAAGGPGVTVSQRGGPATRSATTNARPCCSLISQVIVTRPATDRIAVKIIWVSGHYSEGTVIPPVLHQRHVTGYDTMVERIGQLWAQGATDVQIAKTLSAACAQRGATTSCPRPS